MRVLVACEFSGKVRNAFRARGHDAWSCDLLPAEDGSEFHWRGDVLELLEDTRSDPEFWPPFDLMIAHPPCTYLCSSGLHWNTRRPGRAAETEKALEFVAAMWNAPVPRICIENPQGCINTRLPFMPKPQYVQPYQFGHDASKKTGLWLKNLPPLRPTRMVEPRMVGSRPRWGNQTDSGQNRLAPSSDRWALRAATYEGIAEAMAAQWGYAAGRHLGTPKMLAIGE